MAENVKVVHPRAEPRQGRRRTYALQHATEEFAAILDADLEYRAGDLARCSNRWSRAKRSGLRHARVDVSVVVQLWYVVGQQGGHDGDERPLRLLDLGRHDVHKAMRTELFRSLPLRERGFAIEPRSPTMCCARASDPRGTDPLSRPHARSRQETDDDGRPARPPHARPLPPDVSAPAVTSRSTTAELSVRKGLIVTSYVVLGAALLWSRLLWLGHSFWTDEIIMVRSYVRGGPT